MTELMQFIFSSFWVWAGTIALITSVGYALSIPFHWWFKIRQIRMNRVTWDVN